MPSAHLTPSRREFLHAVGAAALLPYGAQSAARQYDVLITGGRVVDPAQQIDRVADVAVAGGRIAAVGAGLSSAAAAEIIDARGKIVTPGLVDIHAHLDAAMLPSHCLSTGVTAIADAGTCGADNVAGLIAIAQAAPNRMRILINLARRGLERAELLNLANVDVRATRHVIEANPEVVVGIKARLSRNVVGDLALDAIARAHEITVPLGLPLMVHVGQTAMPLAAILQRLRPGDIVTHMYAPAPNGMLDAEGRVLPEVREARRRGILFDVGNGRSGHITWDVAERAIRQEFLPDTISSDLTAPGRTDRVFDFPTVISKFLLLGMSVGQVIGCATASAARALSPFRELGTLKPGAAADIAVFELRDGEFEFVDNVNAKRIGKQKLFPVAVVSGGRRVPDTAAAAPAGR